jgi:hypothetical protein
MRQVCTVDRQTIYQAQTNLPTLLCLFLSIYSALPDVYSKGRLRGIEAELGCPVNMKTYLSTYLSTRRPYSPRTRIFT